MSNKQTALITGASVGLGKEFAGLFAKDGHDVVLVARSEDKLKALAAQLEADHKIKAHVVAADLTDPKAPAAIFAAVKAKGVDVDFLVNNAGFGSAGAFLDLPLEREVEMIEVNCTALVKLTHLFTGPMRARKRGRVMNIASTAGFQAGPYMSTYYASKAFVVHFSEGLAFELKDSGVTVTCHCPGATATEFAAAAGNDKSKLFKGGGVATASDVAQHAYRAMMAGQTLSIHGLMNFISMEAVRLSPRSVVAALAARLNRPQA